MATQMAYYPGANGVNQSPFHSRHPGPGGPMGQTPPFHIAGVPRAAPGGDGMQRPPIPPGRHMFHPFNRPYPKPGQDRSDYDSKQLRKSSMRKTVDYYSSVIRMLETRVWQRDQRDRRSLQPDVCYYPELVPPSCYLDQPANAITTRFTKVATNKIRCPVFCLTWTPEGRRLITGASSGEFTLWNGLTFNFETILQAHDSPVRSMVWSHNDSWMVTGDHGGYIKYWQSNMNNVKMFQAHKEAIRGISFSPTDQKLASCSDDGTVRIWDFVRCQEEKILRGHGADVKCVDWHPQKGLVISGSKDNQQPVKLWDPKSGQSLATLHAHKSTVMDAKWNKNGQWLITASRDHLIKLFDIRRLDQELQTFRGHKKEASCLSWHPFHEDLFVSGGSDGAIFFWNVGVDKEVGAIDQAHESLIWSLAWHPIGHILCSGSNDHTSKFWTRNRPGDKMRDKYNLNTLPPGVMPEDAELPEDHHRGHHHGHGGNIPGMGMAPAAAAAAASEDSKIGVGPAADGPVDGQQQEPIGANGGGLSAGLIPGLDVEPIPLEVKPVKKVPYAKPIPRNFQAQWNDGLPAGKKPSILPTPSSGGTLSDDEDLVLGVDPVNFGMEQLGRATLSLFGLPVDKLDEMMDTAQSMPVSELPTPTAVIVDGAILSIEADSELEKAVRSGEENLKEALSAMGLKVAQSDDQDASGGNSAANDRPAEPSHYNRDRELDDDDMSYRSFGGGGHGHDDGGYGRGGGHSGIGPTPTGGLLGDFPRGGGGGGGGGGSGGGRPDFQSGRGQQPIRHPRPPGAHQPPYRDEDMGGRGGPGGGWPEPGGPPPDMHGGGWDRPDRPPYDGHHQQPPDSRDRFGPPGPGRPPGPPQQQLPPHGDHPMNRPFYPPHMPPHHPHQDRYGPPQGPGMGGGGGGGGPPSHRGGRGGWGGPEEEMGHYMGNGGGGMPPPHPGDDDMRHMDGPYPPIGGDRGGPRDGGGGGGGNYGGWGPPPPPNSNFRGGMDGYDRRGEDDYGGPMPPHPPPQHYPPGAGGGGGGNYPGQFMPPHPHPHHHHQPPQPPQQQQPPPQQLPPGRWNPQDGGPGRGGGGGNGGGPPGGYGGGGGRGGPRRGGRRGFNNY